MIYQWECGGGSPDKVVGDYFGGLVGDGPGPVDPFAERLFRSVADQAPELDAIIRRHAKRWSPERMSLVVRNLLRLAIEEMRWTQTPASVVIDEAVEIGRRFAGDDATAFLNGVLDAARQQLAQEAQAKQPEQT